MSSSQRLSSAWRLEITLGALSKYQLHVLLPPRLSDVPVDDIAAAAIEHRHEVVEVSAQVEVRDINVRMVVGL
jgi:hypothetical protein